MKAKAQLTTKQKILSRFVEFRGLHRFNAVKFFSEKNLDEYRLNFIFVKFSKVLIRAGHCQILSLVKF